MHLHKNPRPNHKVGMQALRPDRKEPAMEHKTLKIVN